MEDLLDTDSKLDVAEIQASCCIRSKQLAIDIPFGLTTIRNTATISISSTTSFPKTLALSRNNSQLLDILKPLINELGAYVCT